MSFNWYDLDADFVPLGDEFVAPGDEDAIANLPPYESDSEGEDSEGDPDPEEDPDSGAYKKKSIPVNLRIKVWKYYHGIAPEAECWVGCGDKITFSTFHCGHILAEKKGGRATLENLIPICQRCNSSMGTDHMFDFASSHGLRRLVGWPTEHIYNDANKVPNAVKRRVWFEIGTIITKCSVSNCQTQVCKAKAKYAFQSEHNVGTVSNIKPVCHKCCRAIGNYTIQDFEFFEHI